MTKRAGRAKRAELDVFDRETSKVRVAHKRCDECLFSKNKIVSDARRVDVLESCRRTDSPFVCHKASQIRLAIVCRGFFDEERNTACQVARALGAVAFLDPETGKPAGKPFKPSYESEALRVRSLPSAASVCGAVKKPYLKAFSECSHPLESVVEMQPSTTGGTKWCLDCGAKREQYTQGGPWREWHNGSR